MMKIELAIVPLLNCYRTQSVRSISSIVEKLEIDFENKYTNYILLVMIWLYLYAH